MATLAFSLLIVLASVSVLALFVPTTTLMLLGAARQRTGLVVQCGR